MFSGETESVNESIENTEDIDQVVDEEWHSACGTALVQEPTFTTVLRPGPTADTGPQSGCIRPLQLPCCTLLTVSRFCRVLPAKTVRLTMDKATCKLCVETCTFRVGA